MNNQNITDRRCLISITMYPSNKFVNAYASNMAIKITTGIAFMFALMAMTFILYDRIARNRESKLARAASVSLGIVSSLFPKNIRDRLMNDNQETQSISNNSNQIQSTKKQNKKKFFHHSEHNKSTNSIGSDINNNSTNITEMNGTDQDYFYYKSKPIADLFPNTTIFFGDLVGKFFTIYYKAIKKPLSLLCF